jgi:nucleoside-diphosphate-sugar epimerase
MKILLTGAGGFLGSIISKEISSLHEIFTLSRNSKDFAVDLSTDVPIFNCINFDLVIHAAGLAHIIPTKLDVFHKVNVIGTQNLLMGLENSVIPKKLVFISSVAVYGEFVGDLLNESTPLRATDPYGKSKIEAEQLVISWCKKHKVSYTILRLPLIVGINPPGNLGAMIRGIRWGLYFNICGGTARKSMVLASDIAKFVTTAADVGGIYNLTDGRHPMIQDLSREIARNLGKRVPKNLPFWIVKLVAIVGDLIGNKAPINSLKLIKITCDLTFDDSKARVAFGWDPRPVLSNISFKNLI